jgi:hypothetical protein
MEKCSEKITAYAKKKHVVITERGNAAIYAALVLAKEKGCTTLLIPDQGGWLTFGKLGKKVGFEVLELKTNDALLTDASFSDIPDNSVLLFTTFAGYFAQQDLSMIKNVCDEKSIFIIEDCSAALRTAFEPIGDILVCSFGKWKLINNYHGGCVCFDDDSFVSVLEDVKDEIKPKNLDYSKLLENLIKADERYMFLVGMCGHVKHDLSQYAIVHKNRESLVVVISEEEDKKIDEIKNYCSSKSYEFTLLPREIRLKQKGISIEVKRLE